MISTKRLEVEAASGLRRGARELRQADNSVAQVVCTVQEIAWMDGAAFFN